MAGALPSPLGGPPTRVLVIDDDPLVCWSVRERLEEVGYEVAEAATAAAAWARFDGGIDLVLLDQRLPDADGVELLTRLLAADAHLPVVMMTAYADVRRAVVAMRAGAAHYITKPFDLDELVMICMRALQGARLKRRVEALTAEGGDALDAIVGESRVMLRTKDLLAKVASSPSSTVLLTGESGTGKDLAARAIHQRSARRECPLLNITCSALAPTLLESELFGHERGAFTDAKERKKGLLEAAHTGSVFLDEIGEMAPNMQAKLLRFLEEKAFRRVGGSADVHVDIRIIAATHVNLQEAVRQGSFREDLYYRLSVLSVAMPPLRQRDGDVERLVEHFTLRFGREFHKRIEGVGSSTLAALAGYGWPGNVRELRNAVERAVLLCDRPTLTRADFPMLADRPGLEPAAAFELPSNGIDLAALERSLVVQALSRAGGNRTAAAALLGMNRDQIRYRIEKYDLKEYLLPRPANGRVHEQAPRGPRSTSRGALDPADGSGPDRDGQ